MLRRRARSAGAGANLGTGAAGMAGSLGPPGRAERPSLPVHGRRPLAAVVVGEIAVGSRLAGGASSRLLSLWIDLVRQAGAGTIPRPAPSRPDRHQLNALDCLGGGRHTVATLARAIGVSSALAVALVGRLIDEGAVTVLSDGADGGDPWLAATADGARIAEQDRRAQAGMLSRLLGQLNPARLAVMRQAMGDLARAAGEPPRLGPPWALAAPSASALVSSDPSSPPGGPWDRRGVGRHRPNGHPDPVRLRRPRQIGGTRSGPAAGPPAGASWPPSTRGPWRSGTTPSGAQPVATIIGSLPTRKEMP